MDCEKFDQHVIDALYDELDELTHAALKRHVEGCSRCAAIFSGLRATREVGVLPIEEPSDDLEAKIMAAVNVAQKKAPWPRKLLRGLAWAGSHAMRPQLAMAALFFLVIGSSLLLLRGKPGSMGVAVRVSEKGAPAPEAEGAMPPSATAAAAADPQGYAAAPILAAPTASPAAGAERPAEQQIADGRGLLDDRAKLEAEKAPADKAAPADKDAAKTALADARSVRDTSGCAAAVSKYDEVGVRFPGTGAAADAMWDAASCYKSMGELGKARELYTALQSGGYKERAAQELAGLDAVGNGNMVQNQMAARAPAPRPAPPAAAAPGKADAPSPSANEAKTRPGGGSGGKAPAAPKAQQRAMDSSF
jgi:hypothetical protein